MFLILVVFLLIQNIGNLLYLQPMLGQELKAIVSGMTNKYKSYLRIQVQSNPRVAITKTKKQKVEMISPLKE